MQKYLRLLNLRLDIFVNEIKGLSGFAIIDAISKSESNPQILASFINGNCRKSEIEIAKALYSKGSNRLKIALRNAANAIGNLKDTHLSNFFKLISFRRERAAAISATARKLDIIIWNIVIKAIPYSPPTTYEFLDQKKKKSNRNETSYS
jgi:hypothetical protein